MAKNHHRNISTKLETWKVSETPFMIDLKKTLELIAEFIVPEFFRLNSWWLTYLDVFGIVLRSAVAMKFALSNQSSSVAFGSCLASLYTSIKVPKTNMF